MILATLLFGFIEILLAILLVYLINTYINIKMCLEKEDDDNGISNSIKDGVKYNLGIKLKDDEVESLINDIEETALKLIESAEYEYLSKDTFVFESKIPLDVEVVINRSAGFVFSNITDKRNKAELGFVYNIECRLHTAMVFNGKEGNKSD